MALVNAYMIRRHMGNIPISVVTSKFSLERNGNIIDELESVFDKILVDDDETIGESNIRNFKNTQYYQVADKFINENRYSAYTATPYDETLIIDVDYLIQDDSLNAVWGSEEDFLINDTAIGLDHRPLLGEEYRLNQTGIKMLWATVVYFKKTERARQIFELVSYIRENWEYFKLLYGFGGYLFRNDFAFSIAIHILNGFLENDEFKRLPVPTLLTSTDRDVIYDVADGSITFLYNDLNPKNQNHEHAFYMTKVKGHNVHVMNKLSMAEFLDRLIEIHK
jgi:hypothetical protein